MRQSRPRDVVARIVACMLLSGCLSCTHGSAMEQDRQARQVSSARSLRQLVADRTQENGQELTQFERTDDKKKAYYAAGDKFLTASLDLTDRYWSEIEKTGKRLLRGHLDNYLPIALKQLNYKPAEVMMRSFADSFFSARNPQTGLIPYSYDTWSPVFNVQTGGKQTVVLVDRSIEFYQWFPDDPDLQQKVLALAKATMNYFDFEPELGKKGGMWNYVDVKSGGEPRGRIALTQDFGKMAKGLAYLSQKTGDPRFLKWADQKLEFVWQHRMNKNLPLLYEQFTPTSARITEERSSDTDTLYHVRLLFDLYDLTGEKKYRDWAMAVTNLWFEKAWNQTWGHFVRKLNPDGTAAVDTLYGDGKYNTLYILIHAYRVTKDPKYIDRFKQAWGNLLKMGEDGFVPQRIARGKMVDKYGLDKQQTMFLDILVAAYEASLDKEILQQAEALGTRILQRGETVMRMEGGQAGHAFLRLALARQKIQRLEVIAPGKAGMKLTVTSADKSVLRAQVPADVAVVYLPEGTYNVEVVKDKLSQKQSIKLYSDKQVKL